MVIVLPVEDDIKIVFEDAFHFKRLYEFCHEWLVNNDYLKQFAPASADVPSEEDLEIMYWDRTNMDNSKEVHICWRTHRIINSYYKRVLGINFRTLGLKNVEVTQQGHKFVTQRGEIEVTIHGDLHMDHNDNFKNFFGDSEMGKRFTNWFWKRLMKPQFEKEMGLFKRELYRLQADIKKYLGIQTTNKDLIFHKVKGI